MPIYARNMYMHILNFNLIVEHMYICITCIQGQLNISVQELDGFYTHTLQVEEISSSFELPCHSKIRK